MNYEQYINLFNQIKALDPAKAQQFNFDMKNNVDKNGVYNSYKSAYYMDKGYEQGS